MSTNPYNFTDPVRDPRMFYGREALLKEIVANFCAPNPHSYTLFGGRRFGKTSLLRAIERQLIERLTIGREPCVIPIYIDLNFEIIQSRGAFFALVIKRLGETLRAYLNQVDLDDDYLHQLRIRVETEHDPLPLFERAFVYIQSTAFPQVGTLQAVLLIDESERILRQPWAPELHSNLRALLSNRPKVQDHLGIKMAGSSNFYAKITEEGSPLRNILIKRLLPPLSEAETCALINEPTGGILPEVVVDEVVRQTGGHPFLIQYLMHYLWEAGLENADVETVREIVDHFTGERDDFEDWCEGIGPVGEQIYALLCERGDWTRRPDIYRAVQADRTAIRKALEALSYHGLIHEDRHRGFRVGAEMFRAWFEEFKPVVSKSKPDGESGTRPINYHDFELLVTPDRKIRASSEQGEEEGELRLDMNEIRLTLQLTERGNTNAELLKGLGTKLYQALFPANIHAHLRATTASAEAARCGVRLRLIMEPPELSALPWEFLYDADTNTFLANSTQTALSRYIPVPMTRRDIRAASLPLKILVVISSPQGLTPLDTEGEERLIRQALTKHLTSGQVEIDVLKEATIRNINQKLRERSYNVFHFIGHGMFKEDKGYLILADQDNTARPVDDETFSNFFLGNRTIGLVILNACQSAATSSHQAFVGMAFHLVRRGIPAVIAMQYSIADTTAQLFADELYRTLSLGWPVDAAIQATRNAISMEVGLDQPDFATPVLFMRARDGVILSGL